MEYVDGVIIEKFDPDGWGKQWDDIFIEVVSAFVYLESNNILHRDIRPANILIDKNENVKIIDFGFGKKLKNKETSDNSVFLNWPVTELPEETYLEGIYNHQSEIYFIGKLFYHLLGDRIKQFKFYHIIEKMIKVKANQRYKSFNEVSKAISAGVLSEVDFIELEKKIYIEFADQLTSHILKIKDRFVPKDDINATINELANLIRDSALENYIQANNRLINCFVNCAYTFNTRTDIEVACVKEFYELLIKLTAQKQKIVLDNISTRLSRIKIEIEDDLPF